MVEQPDHRLPGSQRLQAPAQIDSASLKELRKAALNILQRTGSEFYEWKLGYAQTLLAGMDQLPAPRFTSTTSIGSSAHRAVSLACLNCTFQILWRLS
jgi:hypothetical protein